MMQDSPQPLWADSRAWRWEFWKSTMETPSKHHHGSNISRAIEREVEAAVEILDQPFLKEQNM